MVIFPDTRWENDAAGHAFAIPETVVCGGYGSVVAKYNYKLWAVKMPAGILSENVAWEN